ncbi:MAG: hypothetical protein HQ582_12940, partial [Planctomycetes bacterium]|nr:hypothetical protein [Planctomycetota bacterium]
MTGENASVQRRPVLSRRKFLAGTAALGLSSVRPTYASAAPSGAPKYRVAIIGHTGRGNYGHGLDTVWREVSGFDIAAVADADEPGLAAAIKRTGAAKGYADYRKMLDEVKPDLVS